MNKYAKKGTLVIRILITAFSTSLAALAKTPPEYNHTKSSHPSRCTLSAEAIVFDRVGAAKYTLVERVPGSTYFFEIPTTPGEPALNSKNLKQHFSPGFRLGATYHGDSNNDLLLSFFRIGNWNTTRSIGPDNPLDWLVMKAPGVFFQTQDFTYQSMTWDYSTKLYNLELSMQKKLGSGITMTAGFRWLRLHDNLQGTIPPPDLIQPTWKTHLEADIAYVAWFEKQPGIPAPKYPPFWNTGTTNNLYGLQIGVGEKLFKHHHFSLDGLIKLGFFWNNASELTGVSMAKVMYDSDASTNRMAFASELGLQFKYQIIKNALLKFGYEALWIAGVAFSPGQIQKTYTTPTSVQSFGVNTNSHVLFHGGSAGLELSF